MFNGSAVIALTDRQADGQSRQTNTQTTTTENNITLAGAARGNENVNPFYVIFDVLTSLRS